MRLLVWVVLILATLIAIDAHAHDFTFTWDDPTQRTNGATLNPNTEIKGYQLRCDGPQNAVRIIDRAASTQVSGHTRRYHWANAVQADGIYECRMTAIDTGDRESDWSNIASVVKVERPAPPTDLRTVP